MLITTQTLRVPFTCVDSTGAAVAPTGTPAVTLYKNGAAQGDAVTVAMSGADGLASVVVTGTQGDCFYLKILATISGVITSGFSLPVYLSKLPADAAPSASDNATAAATAILVTPANKLVTDNTGKVTATNAIPSASDNGSAAATAILATPGNKLATDNTGKVTATNAIPSASDNGSAAATAILATPGNKLATDSAGRVTASNGGGGGGSAPSYVMPLRATAGQRVVPGRVTLFLKERVATVLPIVDERGQPVDCSGKTCSLLVDVNGVVAAVHELVPAGSPLHRYSFTPTEAMTALAGEFEFALRTPEESGYEVVAWGVVQVLAAVAE